MVPVPDTCTKAPVQALGSLWLLLCYASRPLSPVFLFFGPLPAKIKLVFPLLSSFIFGFDLVIAMCLNICYRYVPHKGYNTKSDQSVDLSLSIAFVQTELAVHLKLEGERREHYRCDTSHICWWYG